MYLFARTRAGAREGPLKFVSIVTPQPLARQLSAGGAAPRPAGSASPARGGAAPPPTAVVQLRFHPSRTSVALATAAGEIFVVELGLVRSAETLPAFACRLRSRHSRCDLALPPQGQGRSGSVTLTCKDVHLGSAITALVRAELHAAPACVFHALTRVSNRRGRPAATGCSAATSAAA